MSRMFGDCYELEYLDLSNFDTSKVTNMEGMFYKCYKLKEIKGINNFNAQNAFNKMKGIFEDCVKLKNIKENLFKVNVEKKENEPIEVNNSINIEKREICLHFTSMDQHINCSITCYNTDNFKTVEENLYERFPGLRNQNLNFLTNGMIIKKQLSLEQNKIKRDSHIIICEDN